INISSVHEIIPWPHYAHYTASKGGVKLLTQTLALEYSRLGIRVNNIAPGSVNTPINEDFFSHPEEKEGADDFVPMGFVAEPEHISTIAAFMASDESVYITGPSIVADGGLSLYPSHRNPEDAGQTDIVKRIFGQWSADALSFRLFLFIFLHFYLPVLFFSDIPVDLIHFILIAFLNAICCRKEWRFVMVHPFAEPDEIVKDHAIVRHAVQRLHRYRVKQ